jgi:transcriptional regulator with XRE-family HTH domain/Zn-dependent peptidase ImmA (M78 family)
MRSFEERLVGAVKQKREALGLSIRGLSEAVGISFSSLARIERGEGQPDNNSKIRLLQWLGADAEAAGLGFENVAFVHFRAARNIQSTTVRALLRVADCLHQSMGGRTNSENRDDRTDHSILESVALSKEDLEEMAVKFRSDLGLSLEQPLDSLRIQVDGVTIIRPKEPEHLDAAVAKELKGISDSEWSAMSVPLDSENDDWAVLLNDSHNIERQRVTVLEELWHILLGHKLTKIARVAEAYGRTYDEVEEHDAYYLASATLLPKSAIVGAVSNKLSSKAIAKKFGTSPELVEYRIKRLGLWWEYSGKQIRLSSD